MAAATAAALLLAACGPGDASPELLIDRLAAQRAAALQPASMDLAEGGAFATRQSAYADNLSPALAWAVTPGAQSYALVIEDPDSLGGQPFVHWLIWNIPGDAVGLPEGVPQGGQVAHPPGAVQGISDAHTLGYFGPHPPSGTGLHHYVIELFALDTRLELKAGRPLADLETAMKGHVVAKGRLVATAAAPR